MICEIHLRVNGKDYPARVRPDELLVDVLRDQLGLQGTKKGCGTGDCGACTVLLDGKPANSCLILAVAAEGCDITTIEGLSQGATLHPVQQAFIDHGAVQCGFCTPGMLMNAYALLLKNPKMTREQIVAGMENNLCRCSAYTRIIPAIESVAKK